MNRTLVDKITFSRPRLNFLLGSKIISIDIFTGQMITSLTHKPILGSCGLTHKPFLGSCGLPQSWELIGSAVWTFMDTDRQENKETSQKCLERQYKRYALRTKQNNRYENQSKKRNLSLKQVLTNAISEKTFLKKKIKIEV